MKFITFSDGCLGSCNDEERSEMRYVMRIAESVNHQIFERTLHFWATRSIPVWVSVHLTHFMQFLHKWTFGGKVCVIFNVFAKNLCKKTWGNFLQHCWLTTITLLDFSHVLIMWFYYPFFISIQTSNQERRPPEFKHIIKGRKRN